MEITLPEIVEDATLFKVNAKYGLFTYKAHYDIIDDGQTLVLYMQYINDLEASDIIEIYYYKEIT